MDAKASKSKTQEQSQASKSGAGPGTVVKVSTTKNQDVDVTNLNQPTNLIEAYTAEQASDGMVAGRKPTCDETEQCDGMVAGRKPTHDETEQCDGMVAGRKPTCDETEQCDGMVAGRKPTCDETQQCSHSLLVRPKTFVAAIDIGPTYSRTAFSSRREYVTDPLKINMVSGRNFQDCKTPTCVLFDPQKRFDKFGFEAEDKYTSIASGEEAGQDQREWFFFRRLKLMLYYKKNLQRWYRLQDESGKEMPALDVFSAAIGYFKNRLIKKFQCSLQDSFNENTDILWVLTVPAYWSDLCKQFMREAANKAGIKSDNLLIALEPVAASLCYRHQSLHGIPNHEKRSMFESFEPGSKYMVLDAGDGTFDISVYEIEKSGKLRELYASNWGNREEIYLEEAFKNCLASIVGKNILDNLQINFPDDYTELFREFEKKMCNFRKNQNEDLYIRVPPMLSKLFNERRGQNFNEFAAAKFQRQGNIRMIADKLRVDAVTANDFFNDACKRIVNLFNSLFRSGKVDGVPTILMVGRFSESRLLKEIIQNCFKDKRLIIPTDPDIAVLKGAVIFGHDPTVIDERRCRRTYGVESSVFFRN